MYIELLDDFLYYTNIKNNIYKNLHNNYKYTKVEVHYEG